MEAGTLLIRKPVHSRGIDSARLPLLLKLFDDVLGREVEIDLGRQQCVMAQRGSGAADPEKNGATSFSEWMSGPWSLPRG